MLDRVHFIQHSFVARYVLMKSSYLISCLCTILVDEEDNPTMTGVIFVKITVAAYIFHEVHHKHRVHDAGICP
jgi:hypothetical protein